MKRRAVLAAVAIGSFCAAALGACSSLRCGSASTLTGSGAGSNDAAPAIKTPATAAGPRFLKGQLHAHSNRSGDSDTPPEEVAAWYARRGYDFLVFTDHNRVTDTLDPPGMLTIPGVELTQNLTTCDPPPLPENACLLHVNALFVERPRSGGALPINESLRRLDLYARAVFAAKELGGIPQLNHPNFHFAADADIVVELAKQGLVLLEIANQAVDSANEGDGDHPSTEELWDQALTRGARVFGTATDDAHHYNDAAIARGRGETAYVGDLGFVMVRAEPTVESLRAAILAGEFYSSTGVLLDRLEMREEGIVVDVRGGDERTHIEAVGRGGAVVASVWGGVFRVDPKALPGGYVRVRVRDSQGKRAWTQPLFWPL
jgi:hypothetical protein